MSSCFPQETGVEGAGSPSVWCRHVKVQGEVRRRNKTGYQTAGQLIVEPSGSKQELRRSTGIKHEIKKRL